MADLKTPETAPKADAAKAQPSYKVADVRDRDVTLEMEDGRVFLATVKDGINLDDLKRHALVTITSDGMDKSDAPKDAQVVRILPKE